MSYIIADIGGNLSVSGLPAEANAATAMDARLVGLDSRLLTGWVAQTDGQNGNNWSAGTFVAHFDTSDFTSPAPRAKVEVHIRLTIGGVQSGYKSANVVEIEYPTAS